MRRTGQPPTRPHHSGGVPVLHSAFALPCRLGLRRGPNHGELPEGNAQVPRRNLLHLLRPYTHHGRVSLGTDSQLALSSLGTSLAAICHAAAVLARQCGGICAAQVASEPNENQSADVVMPNRRSSGRLFQMCVGMPRHPGTPLIVSQG